MTEDSSDGPETKKTSRQQREFAKFQIQQSNLALAHAQSMDKHAYIIQSFAANFVNLFAIFHLGAFAAAAATIPTKFGQLALKEQLWPTSIMFVSLAAGFITSSALMVVIFQYSLNKFGFYRGVLKGESGQDAEKLKGWAHVFLALMILFTITAWAAVFFILLQVDIEN